MSSWSFRDTALDDIGIVTMVSDSLRMPERRGENVMIPFHDGRVFVEKFFEQRSLTLGLEINEATLQDLESKLDTFKSLLGKHSLGTLAQTLEDASVRTLQVEYTGDLNLKRISPLCVRLVLEFIAPDPFFQGEFQINDLQEISSSPTLFTLTNPGTADIRDPRIILTGPLDQVTITNTSNGVSLSYNAAIDAPRIVTIDKNGTDYVATDDLGVNVIGNVTHSGDSALFVLDAGDNELEVVDSVATSGSVAFEFYPLYL